MPWHWKFTHDHRTNRTKVIQLLQRIVSYSHIIFKTVQRNAVGSVSDRGVIPVRYPVPPHAFVEIDRDFFSTIISSLSLSPPPPPSPPFNWFKKGSCQLLDKYGHWVLWKRSVGLCLPSKCVVRLTDRPDMTIAVYPGSKAITEQSKTGNVPWKTHRL